MDQRWDLKNGMIGAGVLVDMVMHSPDPPAVLIVVAAYGEPPCPRSYPTQGAPYPVMLREI